MATNARFDPATLQRLERVREVEIETTSLDGSTQHRTPIWIVTDEGDAFIRSERGVDGRWYREARAQPDATLQIEGAAIAVTVVLAADPDSIKRVSDALSAKYGRRSAASTAAMLEPHTLETTLRVEPRAANNG